ncbi:hypothetical protein MH117_16805 [Paenibacillus sp. ACRRX]|uniref:hypothetical protein n=1 Tax=unclassified Paenibacillus TaxID=185978 RepID=UPI001EF6AEF6|nr:MULTISPECIES: hypothetical protein [unclassified Paenibacillus]MCG7409080.1 hypothetical protein [Paenibacillus sp. ACRRX]MDK8181920.1 hypothetical protein [Paenibacillus sp. UMB4589-SE434]
MTTWSSEQAKSAVLFLKQEARPLERVLYEWEFEAGSVEAVIEQLALFQNKDRGFGKALEPDIRMNNSSVIATTVALQTMSYVNLPVEHPLAADAITYLLDAYQTGKQGWNIVPDEVDEHPRAPWWDYRDIYDGWGNPNLEIVGYLYEYPHVAMEFREKITEHAVQYLLDRSPLNEFHELLCTLRMAARLPQEELEHIRPQIETMVQQCVVVDPEAWNGYCLTPLQVADSPDSPYYEQFAAILPTNLEFLIRQQQPDGAWHPAWSWGQYESEWPQAKREWQGVLTLQALRTLRAYGLLALQ